MVKPNIQIDIVYDGKSKDGGCGVSCGIDWSSVEALASIKRQIKERFGNRVRPGYLDLSRPGNAQRATEIRKATGDKTLSLPLLVINGKPRISGKFDIHLLLDAIEAELEIEQDGG